ncbi:hypothetical protein [Candidatus Nanohalobium constans]|nr:hypothetical protein [Candidatus Nanohalobium constans]
MEGEVIQDLLNGETLPADKVFQQLEDPRLVKLTENFPDGKGIEIDGERNHISLEKGFAYKAKRDLERRTIPGVLGEKKRSVLRRIMPFPRIHAEYRTELVEEFGDYNISLYTDPDNFVTVYHAAKTPQEAEEIIRDGKIKPNINSRLREKIGVTPVIYTNEDHREMRFYLDGEGVVFEIEVHEARLGYGNHSDTLTDEIDLENVVSVYPEEKAEHYEALLKSQGYNPDINQSLTDF